MPPKRSKKATRKPAKRATKKKAASRKPASRKPKTSKKRCSSKNVRTGKIRARVSGGRANGGRWVFTGSTAKGNMSAKFWEMNVSGRTLTTRWGRLGTQGLQKSKTYTCDGAARAAALALVRSKEAKGYRRR